MNPILSIIIPTHKRATILKRTLEHLEAQTITEKIEVIVVSDGPDAETRKLFAKKPTAKSQLAIRFFEIPKSHQGVARNRGVKEAKGNIILFIGDDIFLAPAACERHLNAHHPSVGARHALPLQTKTAVLGFTTWDPDLQISPVMSWLERTGWQFGYPMIHQYRHMFLPHDLQHRFTYTSHISVPAEIAKQFPFREDVSLYGWEDIEWGMRLKKAGVKLFYEPDAHAWHHHHMTMEASLKRMAILGESAVKMEKIAPSLQIIPCGWKRVAYRVLSLLPTMKGRHARAFLDGIQKGSTMQP